MKNKPLLYELTEKEMEQTAAGSCIETITDSVCLFDCGLLEETFSPSYVAHHRQECFDTVAAAWAEIGITCTADYATPNKYFCQGREITQRSAQLIACRLAGRKWTWK